MNEQGDLDNQALQASFSFFCPCTSGEAELTYRQERNSWAA
jgi:hypothetical protein